MFLDQVDVVRTRYRNNFAVYKYDDIISASLRWYGEYQQIEINIIQSLLEEDSVIYDIGSNIGYHASAFASMAKQVYGFEAHPKHFSLLRANVGGDPRCEIYNVAVSDSLGVITVEDFNPSQISNYGAVTVGAAKGLSVATVTIDHMVESGKILPPDLIKMDVEGHEFQALTGARQTLARYLPLVYVEAQMSEHTASVYDFLDELGYRMGWIIVRNYNADNFNRNQHNIFSNSAIFSILAVPPGYSIQLALPVKGRDDTWEKMLEREGS